MKYELTLELPPNIANARMHWRRKARLKSNYFMACRIKLRNRELPEPPDSPLSKAKITVHANVWSLMDMDNLFARLKWPVDWLQDAGYIADDDPGSLEWELPTQRVNRKGRGLFITLEGE